MSSFDMKNLASYRVLLLSLALPLLFLLSSPTFPDFEESRYFCGISVAQAASTWRGVAPEDLVYFLGKQSISCRDGSKTIPIERVNDDFCDCPDGTDEPGTSACAMGRFYCRNRGHTPLWLFSSRVNDGICDCCDGSDEFEGREKCENTCISLGAATREELKKKLSTFREGAKLRQGFVTEAKVKRAKWEEEKTAAETEKSKLEEEERILKARKDEVEKAEREAKEWEEKLKKEQEERDRVENENRKKNDKGGDEAVKEDQEPGLEDGDIPPPPPTPEFPEGFPEELSETGSHQQVESEEKKAFSEEQANYAKEEEGEIAQFQPPPGGFEPAWNQAQEEELERNAELERLKQIAEENAARGIAADEIEEHIPEEKPKEASPEEDFSNLSPDEIGRRIASRWTGGSSSSHATPEPAPPIPDHTPEPVDDEDFSHIDEGYNADGEGEGYTGDEEDIDYHQEDEDFSGHEDEDDHDVVAEDDLKYQQHGSDGDGVHAEDEDEGDDDVPAVSPVTTWWARMLQWPRNFCSKIYSFVAAPRPSSVDKIEADRVKKEHSRVETELGRTRTRVRQLKEKLEADYGPSGEFITFVDKCYSIDINQYAYEICPYKRVTQKEGHSHANVGQWRGFTEDYSAMIFRDGDGCWNGPSRSMKVELLCGSETKVLSVSEPSRCEYLAIMSTPTRCTDEHAKVLEDEIAAMEKDLTLHDEL